MKILCSCIVCREVKSVKGIHTHYLIAHDEEYQKQHRKNSIIGNNSVVNNSANIVLKRQQKYLLQPKKCKYCDTVLPYEKRNLIFCNNGCAAKFQNKKRREDNWTLSDESKKSIGDSLRKNALLLGKTVKVITTNVCDNCKSEFVRNKHQRFCSVHCSMKFRNKKKREQRTDLVNYRDDCAFKFSIRDYSEEFDFVLIEQYGWYKAKNRGDNLNGISRDHMVSIRYGFDNNIPPEHLSHPANCRLIRHNDNVSKGSKNHITYEELLIRIEVWDKKYKK